MKKAQPKAVMNAKGQTIAELSRKNDILTYQGKAPTVKPVAIKSVAKVSLARKKMDEELAEERKQY